MSATAEAVKNALKERTCIHTTALNNSDLAPKHGLPGIDIFLNPAKKYELKEIIKQTEGMAKKFFTSSDLKTMYAHLFRILWESTLPCFGPGEDHMLVSCELAGSKVNCSNLFRKVPTDIGMCCALNAEDSLADSKYKSLVTEMQSGAKTKTVKSGEGIEKGLRLTMDLHTNKVSFGTLSQAYNAFNILIGGSSEFPMLRKKSIKIEPGREHFIELSATLVSSKGVRGISPEARDCFFTDEGDLDFYKKYSLSNCRLECGIKMAEEVYHCIPWHLPQVLT